MTFFFIYIVILNGLSIIYDFNKKLLIRLIDRVVINNNERAREERDSRRYINTFLRTIKSESFWGAKKLTERNDKN